VPAATVALVSLTLSGEQTVNGVAVKAINLAGLPDRVLATAQTSAAQNGLWDVQTGAWTRSIDANGNYDLTQGTQVAINGGGNAGQIWMLTTAAPITVGTTAMTFIQSVTSAFLATLASSSGASLIGFIQSGAGAVLRTLQAKERERVSVKDYGAVGDGVTNDTTAFQACRTYCLANSCDMVVPTPGIYVLTAGTNWAANGFRMIGLGKPVLDFSAGTGPGFVLDAGGSGSHLSRMRIENFDIKGGPSITDIFYRRGVVSSIFRNINVYEGTGTGFKVLFGVSDIMEKLTCSVDIQTMSSYPTNAFYLGNDGGAGNECSNISLISCEGKVPGKTGLALADSTARCHWMGGALESCSIGLNILTDTCRWNVFQAIDMESNTTNDAIVKGQSNTFIGSFSNSASSGNSFDVTTAKGTVFEGGGYYRQIVLGAGSANTHFGGITTDQTIGISGAGTFTRSGCKKADNSGNVVGTWPDVLGATTTGVAFVATQGVTPTVTLADNESIVSGQMVNLQAKFTFTSAGTAANAVLVDFPAGFSAKASAIGKPVGKFVFIKGGTATEGTVILQSAVEFAFYVNGGTSLFGINPATTIANTDVLHLSAFFPLA
jgi:hypothetical protein